MRSGRGDDLMYSHIIEAGIARGLCATRGSRGSFPAGRPALYCFVSCRSL